MKQRWAISGVIIVLACFAEAANAADKVRISVSSLDAAFLTPAVALKRGFFKEEDIEAEVIRMNANVSITALATGDIDYTTIFGSVAASGSSCSGTPRTAERSSALPDENTTRVIDCLLCAPC